MSESFVGETRLFAFGFAPAGWALCDGALMPISEFEELFQLIGTIYGGDGETSFALPNSTGPESDGTALNICISLFGFMPAPG